MRTHIPLEALRTFEVAARRGSLTAAARELHLTDSAVSHQLRRLRQALGFDLFVRQGRTVRLSSQGASFLKTLRPALQSIGEAAERLRDPDGTRGPLTIACSSMFASRVLSHHIGRFAEGFPHIECYVRSMENDQVLTTGEADIGILFGTGRWPAHDVRKLADVRYSPVCSPRLLASPSGIPQQPADLLNHVIIHNDQGEEWRTWLARAGVPADREVPRKVYTNDVGVALEMARQGGGITLASDLLASADLATGTLIRPFDLSIEVTGAWHLVCPRERANAPRVQVFVTWLCQALDLPDTAFA
ncbi:MAG: LysR substrate-binding domain-containing protein [Parvibaculaceae bacterium]